MTIDELSSVIIRLIEDELLPREFGNIELKGTTRLDELGLDSVGRMTLLNAVESHLGVLVPEAKLWGAATVGEMVEAL